MPDPIAGLPEPGESLRRAGIDPVHPGAFFKRRVLDIRHMTVEQAALEMQVDAVVLDNFVRQRTQVDERLASKLAAFVGSSAMFWLNMQKAADGQRPATRRSQAT